MKFGAEAIASRVVQADTVARHRLGLVEQAGGCVAKRSIRADKARPRLFVARAGQRAKPCCSLSSRRMGRPRRLNLLNLRIYPMSESRKTFRFSCRGHCCPAPA
jgi:hypothetical protein